MWLSPSTDYAFSDRRGIPIEEVLFLASFYGRDDHCRESS